MQSSPVNACFDLQCSAVQCRTAELRHAGVVESTNPVSGPGEL